jgi:dGTPase
VTQVVIPGADAILLHNRLTHSEKVAQVARTIAENLTSKYEGDQLNELGGLDPDVVETAALAHDLGHPPFGHAGEEMLNKLALNELQLSDGFEGNAQTFRIVTKLSLRHPRYDGLGLTRASLAAIAKYPWAKGSPSRGPVDRSKKFGVYHSEIPVLKWAQEFLPQGGSYYTQDNDKLVSPQTLEAAVMDAADDITYAIHDLEDFYFAGLLSKGEIVEHLEKYERYVGTSSSSELIVPPTSLVFGSLAQDLASRYPDYYNQQDYLAGIKTVITFFNEKFMHSTVVTRDHERLARSGLSEKLGDFILDVRIEGAPLWLGGPRLLLGSRSWHEVQILKTITREFVVKGSDLSALQQGQQHALEELVKVLHWWVYYDRTRLPRRLLEEVEITESQSKGQKDVDMFEKRGEINRCILDYLCTLTDEACLHLFRVLGGSRDGSLRLRSSF